MNMLIHTAFLPTGTHTDAFFTFPVSNNAFNFSTKFPFFAPLILKLEMGKQEEKILVKMMMAFLEKEVGGFVLLETLLLLLHVLYNTLRNLHFKVYIAVGVSICSKAW